ncbi:hypothetical protein N7G274_007100 [Stereocaulon virgatum]|uniref:Uncharacterized protein n=1 Tax=Stereocaulon virgatum TaxID=373712 RepID=A0ABR4A2M5_9LECA
MDAFPENTDANTKTINGPTNRKTQPGDYEDIRQQRKRQHEDEDVLSNIEASSDRESLNLGLENMEDHQSES